MGTLSGLNWSLEMLVFEERENPEYLEKNLSEQGREPTTNSSPGIKPEPNWWEGSALTTVLSLLSPPLPSPQKRKLSDLN